MAPLKAPAQAGVSLCREAVTGPDLDDRLEREAAARKTSKSAVVRDCVEQGLALGIEGNGLLDARHEEAAALAHRPTGDNVVTSDLVLGETWTFIRRRVGHRSAHSNEDARTHFGDSQAPRLRLHCVVPCSKEPPHVRRLSRGRCSPPASRRAGPGLLAQTAWARVSATDTTTIRACLDLNGDLRIVTTERRWNQCPDARRLEWRIQGEPGPAGPAGVQGERGPAGPPGASRS